MKRIGFSLIAAVAIAPAAVFAQDLDTQFVADQFTSGSRSLFPGTTLYNAGAGFTDITGTIEYKPTFENNNAGETQVWDVTTAVTTDDSGGAIPAPGANTGDTSSTSQNMAIYIGDGGGGDNLEFGTTTSANYFVRSAFYCAQRTVAGVNQYEHSYITIRCPESPEATGRNVNAIGGYGLDYEADNGKVSAVKWNPSYPTLLAGGTADLRTNAERTKFADVAVANGWHVFEVAAIGTRIRFKVDGVLLADVSDSLFTSGLAALCYKEVYSSAAEHQGKFDWMEAGPSPAFPPPVTAVEDWSLYN
jgi:hypothetical protein